MDWVKLSTSYHLDDAIMRAGEAAEVLWLRALTWAAHEETAGRVPTVVIPRLVPGRGEVRAAALVREGLWAPREGGWQFPRWPHLIFLNRATIPDWVRMAVYERDGWVCVDCEATEPLTLDHVIPWSLGGGDGIDNLQTLCRPCNLRKGARI